MIFPCDRILEELQNSLYVVLSLKYVFILIMIHFLSFFLSQNMKHSVHNWWKNYVILNIMSLKNVLLFYSLVFPTWYFHQCCSCS